VRKVAESEIADALEAEARAVAAERSK